MIMNASCSEHANPFAIPEELHTDHNAIPLASLPRSAFDPALFDIDRMHAILSGLVEPPPRVTLKGIVREQLSIIRAARRRGWSIADIARTLTDSGCSINEATLRKYLNQLERPKAPRRQVVANPLQRIASDSAKPVDTLVIHEPSPTVLHNQRRSLRRSAYLNPESLTSQEKSDA